MNETGKYLRRSVLFQGNRVCRFWTVWFSLSHEALRSICQGALTHVINSHQRAAIPFKTHLSAVLACASDNPTLVLPDDLVRWFCLFFSGPSAAANTQPSVRCDTKLERVSKRVFHHSLCSLQGRLSWEMIGFPNVGEFQMNFRQIMQKCRFNTLEVGTSSATFRHRFSFSYLFFFFFFNSSFGRPAERFCNPTIGLFLHLD